MKKLFSVVIAFLAIVQLSTAQTDYSKFRMGFKVSPNVSWLQPQDKHFINEGSVLRFGFGFNADIFFAPNYAIGTGVNIMRNGGQISYLETGRVDTTEVILRRTRNLSNQYIEIPLTFKLRTNEIGYITYWGQFGFGLGVNINSRGDDERDYLYEKVDEGNLLLWKSSEFETITEEDVNFSDELQLFRMSMILAAGIEYNLSGSTSLLVGVTFNNGFTNIFAKNNVVRTDSDEPVFQSGQPIEDVRLRANASSIELNLGILF